MYPKLSPSFFARSECAFFSFLNFRSQDTARAFSHGRGVPTEKWQVVLCRFLSVDVLHVVTLVYALTQVTEGKKEVTGLVLVAVSLSIIITVLQYYYCLNKPGWVVPKPQRHCSVMKNSCCWRPPSFVHSLIKRELARRPCLHVCNYPHVLFGGTVNLLWSREIQ